MEFPEVENKIKIATNKFEAWHSDLLEVKANERSMTHKLAECLQNEFGNNWDVDCEYNRKSYDPKRLSLTPEPILSDDENATTVYPDIIVHRRLTQDNLLVIEAKKVELGTDNTEHDREKLRAFLSQLGYKFAVLVKFRTAPDLAVEWERITI